MKIANEGFYDGKSFDAYRLFGAHPQEEGGTFFCLYAPEADKVEVIGDFNGWNGAAHRMNREAMHGVHTLLIPEAEEEQRYKYRIYRKDGQWKDHIDPYGRLFEPLPGTASVIWSASGDWDDSSWDRKREKQKEGPVNIYEMHFGSWKQGEGNQIYSYEEMIPLLIPYLKEHHYTHIELLPLCEYPFDGSWGYQITGYFAPTFRYGRPEQLKELIRACHRNGIGVIMDFVPIHFAVDEYGLSEFDGSCLYEYDTKDVGSSQWGTKNFNLYRGEVRSFLKSVAAYWIREFHMDGIRMDAIRNGIYWQGQEERGVNPGALEFFRELNDGLHQRFPGVLLIAEDSSSFRGVTEPTEAGGLGFDYKWDMGWMHDTLNYMASPPWEREGFHNKLTFSMYYFYQEKYLLPLSHDEVVHGKYTIINKLWGTYEEKFAQGRTLYTYMFTHPGKKLNFMGNELGQFREWDEDREQDWLLLQYPKHQEFNRYFKRLGELYVKEPALYEQEYEPEAFRWLDVDNAQEQVFAYERRYKEESILVILNMSALVLEAYQVGTDCSGEAEVLCDSDAWNYGGESEGLNGKKLEIKEKQKNGLPRSITARLGAYGSLVIKAKREKKERETSS